MKSIYKMQDEINFGDFAKIEMRVGTVIEVNDFPEARNPAYQLKIDFGPAIGVRKTSAQITSLYKNKEELIGKQLVAVINFPKKQIANFMSECLILGAVEGKNVTLLRPDFPVENGLKIS